ncbi:MAG: translocation/assembly module TamB domain-containing protein [Bacteroidales bacterium]
MGKIKKISRFTIRFLIILSVILVALFLLLRSPAIQTPLAKYIATKINERTGSEISFDDIKITFFNRINVQNVLIFDLSGDTLLYSSEITVGLRGISNRDRSLRLGRIIADNPVIGLRTDSAGNLNAMHYLSMLAPEDTSKSKIFLSVNQIKLTNGRISFIGNETAKAPFDSLMIEGIYLTADDLRKRRDKIDLNITDLSFRSNRLPDMLSLSAGISISENHIYLVNPLIRTSASYVSSELLGVYFPRMDSTFSFFTDADFTLNIENSWIGLADLKLFVNLPEDQNHNIYISGDINGPVSELRGKGIDIRYLDTTRILFDFNISGLPDIKNTYIFTDIEELVTTTTELEKLPLTGDKPIDVPQQLMEAGMISFEGNFNGFITDFVTYGTFRTGIGNIYTDLLLEPDKMQKFVFSGSVRSEGLDIGMITGRPDLLGRLTMSAIIEGSLESFSHFAGEIEGTIDSIEFNDFLYRDIDINGSFTENIWDGSVITESDDLAMDLLGRFNFSGETPEVDFSLNLKHADLHKLNLDPDSESSDLSVLMTATFSGDNIDNLEGDIRVLNSSLKRNGKRFDLYDASIVAGEDNDIYRIKFRSDFANADIAGKYNLRSVADDMKGVMARLAPTLFESEEDLKEVGSNDFTYAITFRESDQINSFFETGIRIAPETVISGRIHPDSLITLHAAGDYFVVAGNTLADFNMNGVINGSEMVSEVKSSNLNLLNRIDLNNIEFKVSSEPDKFTLSANWDNPGNIRNTGNITATGNIEATKSDENLLNLSFSESTVIIRDQEWIIHPSVIQTSPKSVTVDNFLVSHGNDYFNINGRTSPEGNDTLAISFQNLNLDILNSISKKNPDDDTIKEFTIEGVINGNILVRDIFTTLLFESDILIDNFKTNDHIHGDVTLLSKWDTLKKSAEISMFNNLDGDETFRIDGNYIPDNSALNLSVGVDRFPLDILNLVLHSFASDVSGYGTGNVTVSGSPKNLMVTGSVFASDASITIDYLQSEFIFSDTIFLEPAGLVFRDITVRDNRDNTALLNGIVTHTGFQDFGINLRINAENILALDTRQADNSLFYGTAFASGVISITGPANSLRFDISARTGRNTRLFIPLNADAGSGDYSFFTFQSSDTVKSDKKEISVSLIPEEVKGSIELNFDLTVTPDAEVQLVFDSSVGDIMRGRGTGNLNMSLSRAGEFSIYGDYVISEGDYLFTLGNIFNKRFIVEEGGVISWNGDISDAELSINAIYKLRTSLYELLQDEAFRQRIPVDCHLNMSGKLINPVIGFDIQLPTADEQTRTYLRNAINSDEEMSRQFLYLMVMNSFYPSTGYASSINTQSAGASAMGVTTTEMLSNQLSNWLSQISSDFDIGFNYRPGNEISSQEVEVALSTQLLNDRVIINGNFDVGGEETTSSTNNITGDFDIEVKLTEKLRFKVFNRSNDNILYETAPYTQGFGLFFRHNFNRFSDFFRTGLEL